MVDLLTAQPEEDPSRNALGAFWSGHRAPYQPHRQQATRRATNLDRRLRRVSLK
ncbi:MAG: hypothetical protein OXH68_16325 [Gammaproteobacteria bacterium]|nr:hypothetical protein [Gammaproteobacteria bacterium]